MSINLFLHRRIVVGSLFLFFAFNLIAQQTFNKCYHFNQDIFTEINKIDDEIPANTKDFGYVLQPDGTKFPVRHYKQVIGSEPKVIYSSSLKGIIDFRDEDNFYFHFWDITDNKALNGIYIQKSDSGASYVGVAKWSPRNYCRFIRRIRSWLNLPTGNNYLQIPFSFRSFTATYIPFKYDFNNRQATANLLNFSLAYYPWIRGHTTFFKNQDIQPRDTYGGLGLYIGLNSDPTTNNISQTGVTYGITGIYGVWGLNIIPSIGLENDFNSSSVTHFYFGMGIGFNVVSFSGSRN